MYVTYQDLIQIGIFIVTFAALILNMQRKEIAANYPK